MVDEAGGDSAYLLAQGSGRPFQFARHIQTAAQGKVAEPILPERIRQIWKTDLFLSTISDSRNLAARSRVTTVNWKVEKA
jgi:hypothetical protein